MNVLFLDQFSEPGGAQHCLLELLPALDQAGWSASVALPGDGALLRRIAELDIPVYGLSLGVYPLGRKGSADIWRFVRDTRRVAAEIRTLVRQLRPNLLFVNGPRLLPAVARASTGCPVLFHSHNEVSSRAARRVLQWALARCDACVIAASRSLARQWRRPAQVVYGGVTGPARRPVKTDGQMRQRIGLIARFDPLKGQREFVAAAAALHATLPGAKFILCGDALFGDTQAERYRDRVLAEASAAVVNLGWRRDVYEVLADLDLLVHPSHREGGVPNVILQAFAAGVPVLATPAGGIPEVVSDGTTGFLLPSPSPADIARESLEILSRPAQMAAVADRAFQLWHDRFTVDRYRRELITAMADAVNRRRRGDSYPGLRRLLTPGHSILRG